MQGDPVTHRRALAYPAVLASAHIAMAALVVAVVYQVGTVVSSYVARPLAVAICALAAVVAICVDVRAVVRNTYTVGLKRQTAKVLGHDPDRPWWVTPLLWGLDTGLIWSTFRVSCTSWVLLLSAFLNVAPQWSGFAYGAFFGVPLMVAVMLPEPETYARPDGWPLRGVQLAGMTLLVALPLTMVRLSCVVPFRELDVFAVETDSENVQLGRL